MDRLTNKVEILNAIKELKSRKRCGKDQITNEILKELGELISD